MLERILLKSFFVRCRRTCVLNIKKKYIKRENEVHIKTMKKRESDRGKKGE